MTIENYCYKQGMNLAQYEEFEKQLETECKAIAENTHTTNGVFNFLDNILPYENNEVYWLKVDQLKKLGFEIWNEEGELIYRY